MPTISSFNGITIRMFFADNQGHNKPHIHAYHGEHHAVVGLDGELLAGSIPHKKLTLLQGWIVLREQELYQAWNKAVRNIPPGKITPLK